MKWSFFIGMLLFAALLGAGNNLVNSNRVPWRGSAEVLPKPEGWPSLSTSEGIRAGVQVAKSDLKENRLLVIGAVLILLALVGIALARKTARPVSSAFISWLRIALGVMFLVAAYPKLQDPSGFALLVTQYQLLPHLLVNAFSLWLPAFEITTGLTLLLTPFEKEASGAVLLLLCLFVIALSQALRRDLGIACGCFDIEGAADAGETWFSMVRDAVLLIPVLWMCFKARRRFLWNF
jgi:hypothetical protein